MRDLVLILDAMDEDLLVHVDAEDGLRVETARRMLSEAEALLAGTATFAEVEVRWSEWSWLVRAFADAYELDELDDMYRASSVGDPGAAGLSDADRVYLTSLVGWLRLFVERRAAGEEF